MQSEKGRREEGEQERKEGRKKERKVRGKRDVHVYFTKCNLYCPCECMVFLA